MKTIAFSLFIVICSVAIFSHTTFAQVPANSPVTIPDANLRAKITEALGKPSDAQLTAGDMLNLTLLDAQFSLFDPQEAAIQDLTGLEHAHNLIDLYLSRNDLTDISVLSGLTQLRSLYLEDNNVSDISVLSGLIQLRELYLGRNNLTDISVLSGLTQMRYLSLRGNSISDVSALAGMTQLIELSLGGNNITDIPALAGMTQMRYLYLGDNSITDISALTGMTQLIELSLGGNNITDISALAGFNRLKILYLGNNNISDISALVSLSQLRDLDLRKNPLNDPALDTHIPALKAKGVNILFDDSHSPPVSVPDVNLRAKIAETLGKSSDAQLTAGDMSALIQLNASDANIQDLTGLEHAHNLKYLYLYRNSISDLSPLAELTQLTQLHLSNNSISDVSLLSGLKQLTNLNLGSNSISDVSTLSELTKLTYLSLGLNSISDVSSLLKLTQLTQLYLSNNNITDVSLLSALTQLTNLNLGNNRLNDVSSLAGLTNLTYLQLNNNNISDVSPLANLTKLTYLSLGANSVSDVSALAGLTQLTNLQLNINELVDVSSLSGLTQLEYLYLGNNRIADISVLSGLTQLTTLSVGANPLNYVSINTHIPALQAKGIKVTFSPRTPTALMKISGDDQQGIVTARLPLPFLVEVRDQQNKAFAGVPVAFRVPAGGGVLNPSNTTTDMNGKAQAHLTLGKTPGKMTVRVTAADISQSVQFTATAAPTNTPVTITDVNLRRKIAETLSKPHDTQLTAGDMLALTQLNASDANIQDITGLEHAYNLKLLNLARNSLSDVFLLTKLTQLKTLLLSANPLSYATINTHIPALQTKGIKVTFAPRTPTKMVKISGDAQQGAVNMTLPRPFVVEVRDQDNKVFAGVPVTFRVSAGNGQLTSANTTTDLNGKAQAYLRLGQTTGTTTVNVTAAEVSQSVQFTATVINPPVSVPDANLRAKITETLGKPSNAQLKASDMSALTQLNASEANIQDLTGLEHAYNMRSLHLYNNSISDVSPLSGLTNLTYLQLNNNNISDISPLSVLKQLTYLILADNSIYDLSPLEGLTQLTRLYLGSNPLSDISALAGLTQLMHMGLSQNHLSDVSALAGLTQLIGLTLSGNNLTNVSALAGLTKLETLQLGQNHISDASALASVLSGFTKLTYLQLSGNRLSDVSALASVLSGLSELTYLFLGSNHISEVSALLELAQLTNLLRFSLGGNPLNYAAINTHIPALQAEGVPVEFSPRTPTALMKISGDAHQGVVNTRLPIPFIVEVRDQHDQIFAGVPVTFRVSAGNGQLSTTNTTTDLNGRAQTYLTLGRTPGTITVNVTTAEISQSVQFTTTAFLISSPVAIPDINLRAKIAETLGKPHDGTITVRDMLTLTTLNANNVNIYDLTGLQLAANLTTLALNNNYLTEIAPLAALTQLTTLSLNNNSVWDLNSLTGLTRLITLSLDYNSVSDLAPLVALPQLKTLNMRGNWLDESTFDRHLPAMQAKGVDIRFDPHNEDTRPIVRIVYFLPNDRQPQPDIEEKLDRLIKDVQTFYAEQMEAHGFGRKTFQIETDATGKAVVHYVKGRFPDVYYHNRGVSGEIQAKYDMSKTFLLTTLDVSTELIGEEACGNGNGGTASGKALMPASGGCFVGDWGFITAAHELGHAFGLQHDFRNDVYLMSYGPSRTQLSTQLSYCAAEWLEAHSAFNLNQPLVNNNETTHIEMLPPSLAAPPNAIRLRFEVTDADGLHQVQLLTPATLTGTAEGSNELLSFKALNGSTNTTVEFVTTNLIPKNKAVSIQAIDVHGNISWSGDIPIDVTALLPPAKVITIPDTNLASAIRNSLGLGSREAITTYAMLELKTLEAPNRQITNLTGFEHAKGLQILNLESNAISDISALAKLTKLTNLNLRNNHISDISVLAGLTQLNILNLWNTGVSDISILEGLTQLTWLDLGDNKSISDVSPLAGLTQLASLGLYNNRVSDVSPLAGLTQLAWLTLSINRVSDMSPLVGLNLIGNEWDSIGLYLEANPLSYASIHTHIPAIQAKGIKVRFQKVSHPALMKISGDAQEGIVGMALTKPFIVEAMDAKGKPMKGVDVTFAITTGGGQLSTKTTKTDASGKAQTRLTLGRVPGKHTVTATAKSITESVVIFIATAVEEPAHIPEDVNDDGVVNTDDLILVFQNIGQTGENSADVNGDGVVDITDFNLVLAASKADEAAAPALYLSKTLEGITAADVQHLLTQARHKALTDPSYLYSIAVLEQLLALLLPKETALLANYPNPFNPETWIPYQLAQPAEVTLHIYAMNGTLIRTLALGHQTAGMYHSKSRAAYWDGRNSQGERVASGVYFYTLSVGDFTATHKMLIRK